MSGVRAGGGCGRLVVEDAPRRRPWPRQRQYGKQPSGPASIDGAAGAAQQRTVQYFLLRYGVRHQVPPPGHLVTKRMCHT